jgi:hypothetical protein
MTLEKIIRCCCVCKTAILPDGSVMTEREAIRQGYLLSHGIHSKDCIKEYIEDAVIIEGAEILDVPKYFREATTIYFSGITSETIIRITKG